MFFLIWALTGVLKDMVKQRRWRQPLGRHLQLISEYINLFIAGKGSCSHFQNFPIDLMSDTIGLMKTIDSYNRSYLNWLKANVSNPEKFLNDVKFS